MGSPARLSVIVSGNGSGAARTLTSIERRTSRLASVARRVGRVVAAGMMTGGVALGAFGLQAIHAASETEQALGGMQAVFKGQSRVMDSYASGAATNLGIAREQYLKLGTVIGAQLKTGGTATDQLAGKTSRLIQTGADMAAQFGGPASDAVRAISSALRGERDPIEKYGVALTQSRIDAEAARLGFKRLGGTLSTQATQAATMSLIMADTADAHGAVARESKTVAFLAQSVSAQYADLTSELGTAFLPIASRVLAQVSEWMPTFKRWGTAVADALANMDLSKLAPLSDGFRKLGGALADRLPDILPAVTDAMTAMGDGMTWLSQHSDVLSIALGGLVAAFAVYRLAQVGATVAQAASLPLKIAQVAATLSLAAANRQLAATQGATVVTQQAQNTAGNIGLWTRIRQSAAWVASKAIMVASAVATGVMTAAQWSLNAALNANPIGLVILAVAALVAAVVWAYHNVDWFKAGVDAAWAGIKWAFKTAVDWICGVAIPWLGRQIKSIGAGMTWVWRYAIAPAWRAIRAAFAIGQRIIGGVVTAISRLLRGDISGAMRAMQTAMKDGIDIAMKWFRALPGDLQTAMGNLAHKLVGAGKAILQGFLDGLRAKWGDVTRFVGGIGDWIQRHKGPLSYDRRLLVPAGRAIMASLSTGLADEMPSLARQLAAITEMITGVGGTAEVELTAAGRRNTLSAANSQAPSVTVNVTGFVGSENELMARIAQGLNDWGRRTGRTSLAGQVV